MLEGGVAKLEDGVAKSEDGVAKLEDGVAKAEDNVAKSGDGVAKSGDGVVKLEDAAAKLEDATAKLEDGVTKSEDRVARSREETQVMDCGGDGTEGFTVGTNENVTCGAEIMDGTGEGKERRVVNKKLGNKLYLAPLTTVGNLPFRRLCKEFGAEVTCSEMALCTSILQGHRSEWALLKKHHTEDLYGVQLCGSHPDTMAQCAQLLGENMELDFIDLNLGCPIDLVFNKGAGSALMEKPLRLESICRTVSAVSSVPLTIKLRTGVKSSKPAAHSLIPRLPDWGVSLVSVHGRSREARYTSRADWPYLARCAQLCADQEPPLLFYGCGDILSYEEAEQHRSIPGMSGLMVARGALYKPWIFTEIKEGRHWDISAGERFDMLKRYVNFGLEHWGSDQQGVDTTRRFLLEFLSFTSRYIPVGLLEQPPQRINEKPPRYEGRSQLETLLSSPASSDWVRISEMLLGPVSSTFNFLPKHKANSYA